MNIEERLRALADPAYRDFQAPLVPTVDRETIMGVRIPDVRKLAKELKDTDEALSFMEDLPHRWFDENQLHACLIGIMPRTAEEALSMLDRFLPYVDNWSTCDMKPPLALRKNLPLVHDRAMEWMESRHVYTKRFGITTAMKLFLDEDTFAHDMMERIAEVGDEDYYVKMAASWYWAEALCKERKAALPWFEKRLLEPWIHRKGLQKAVESKHFTAEEKDYFRSLK